MSFRVLALLILSCVSLVAAERQTINVGTLPNDNTGDSLRTAMQKINANFAAIWPTGSNSATVISALGAIPKTDSYIALRSLGSAYRTNATLVLGAAGVNDGGGGVFYWQAASTSSDDGGTVIAPADGEDGRWVRIFTGPVNPRWFGATGDGDTDDTDTLQSAIDYASASTKALHIPAGTYLVSNALYVTDSNLIISGDGGQETIIKATGAHPGPILDVGDGTNRLFGIHIRDLQLNADSGVLPDGLRFYNASEVSAERVQFYNLDHALTIDGVELFHDLHNTYGQNNYGLYLTRQQAGSFGYANARSDKSVWYQNTNAAVLVDYSVGHLDLSKFWIEASNNGIVLTNRANTPVEIDQLSLDGGHFQVIEDSGFEGGHFIHAEPGADASYFIVNVLNINRVKAICFGSTNAIELLIGSNTNVNDVGYNDVSLRGFAVYEMTGGGAVYTDFTGVNGSASDVQVQGNYPILLGSGMLALDARSGYIKMSDTNNVTSAIVKRTTGNDLQILSFDSDSGLGLFAPDITKTIYLDVGNDGNDLVINDGAVQANGTLTATGQLFGQAGLSLGTDYTGARVNLALGDFLIWRDAVAGNNPVSITGNSTKDLAITAGGTTRWTVMSNGVFTANGIGRIASTSGQDIELTPASGHVTVTNGGFRLMSNNQYLRFSKAAGTSYAGIGLDGSDILQIGVAANQINLRGPTSLESATASTLVQTDGTKSLVSIANSAGTLVNNGAGAFQYVPGITATVDVLVAGGTTNRLVFGTGGVLISNITNFFP